MAVEPLGLYVMGWLSCSINDFNDNYGTEADYIIGIHRIFGKVGVDVSYAFYNMYDIDNTAGDLHALILHLDLPEVFFAKPYITLEEDFPVNREILEGGFMYRAGIKYNINLPKLPIDLDASFAGHDGACGKKPETISSVKLTVSSTLQLWKVDVTPMVNFQKRLGYKVRDGGMTEDRIWYGINFSIPF